jgi:hypothetical protein
VFVQIAVHLSLVIGEESKPFDFVGHPSCLGLRVGVRDADQQDVAGADPSGHSGFSIGVFRANANFSPTHALQ